MMSAACVKLPGAHLQSPQLNPAVRSDHRTLIKVAPPVVHLLHLHVIFLFLPAPPPVWSSISSTEQRGVGVTQANGAAPCAKTYAGKHMVGIRGQTLPLSQRELCILLAG